MNRSLLIAVIALVLMCGVAPRAQGTSAADEAAVRAVDTAWAQAFRTCNLKTMDAILHEDLVFIVQGGAIHTKKEQMASVSRCDMMKMDVTPTQIRVYGDIALVHGTADYALKGERANAGRLAYGRAYRKVNGVWRMLQHQSTVVPQR